VGVGSRGVQRERLGFMGVLLWRFGLLFGGLAALGGDRGRAFCYVPVGFGAHPFMGGALWLLVGGVPPLGSFGTRDSRPRLP